MYVNVVDVFAVNSIEIDRRKAHWKINEKWILNYPHLLTWPGSRWRSEFRSPAVTKLLYYLVHRDKFAYCISAVKDDLIRSMHAMLLGWRRVVLNKRLFNKKEAITDWVGLLPGQGLNEDDLANGNCMSWKNSAIDSRRNRKLVCCSGMMKRKSASDV